MALQVNDTSLCAATVEPYSNRKYFNKFSGTIGYYPDLVRKADPYQTEKDLNFSYVNSLSNSRKSDLLSNSFNYSRQNEAAQKKKSSACFLHSKPTSSDHFDIVKFKDHYSKKQAEDFKASFDKVAQKLQSDSIYKEDVQLVVRETLGEDTPYWVLDKFSLLSDKITTYRKISWNEFREAAHRTLMVIQKDCEPSRDKPTWLHATLKDPSISSAIHTTCYQDDFNRKEDELLPLPTMENTSNNTKFASTRILFVGTPKATNHISSYNGHIPITVRGNPLKLLHSNGDHIRPPQYDLRLTRPDIGHLPGYAVFVPTSVTSNLRQG